MRCLRNEGKGECKCEGEVFSLFISSARPSKLDYFTFIFLNFPGKCCDILNMEQKRFQHGSFGHVPGKRCLSLLNQNGSSVVEVMVAIVVFMVIMIGGTSYFTVPQAVGARQKMKRLAVSEAKQRLETFLGLGFHAVVTDSNETGTSVTLAGLTGSRDTTITYVDDAGDGTGGSDADSDIVDYKTITVSISWNDGNSRSISLSTKISGFGN